MTDTRIPVDQVATMLTPFDHVEVLRGSTYADKSTVIVIPTRGTIPWRVVQSWLSLFAPMNQARTILFAAGQEVGYAYTSTIQMILAHPQLSKYRYVMTLEDDNLVPVDAHLRLLESIDANGGYDGVSGIYFTKGPMRNAMAYGDPAHYRATGTLDFRPRDWRAAFASGHLMEVNGIAMGCSLYRMELFRELPAPWFVSVEDPAAGMVATQDLHFCDRAVRVGKRFAVDFRVRVGHLDHASNIVY